jgi:hypothetical protein
MSLPGLIKYFSRTVGDITLIKFDNFFSSCSEKALARSPEVPAWPCTLCHFRFDWSFTISVRAVAVTGSSFFSCTAQTRTSQPLFIGRCTSSSVQTTAAGKTGGDLES